MPLKMKFLSMLPILVTLSLATPVFAQDAPPQTPAVESQLDTGTDLEKLGTSYDQEEIGDWKLRCVYTENDEDPCQLFQLLSDADGQAVAEISVFRLPEDGGKVVAGATVVVPHLTSLAHQLTIAIDGAKGKRYAYAFCDQVGCYARLGLTKDDVSAFKKGAKAVITLVPYGAAEGQKVELDLSLKGFTKGISASTVFQ